jgi:hypothetical protein
MDTTEGQRRRLFLNISEGASPTIVSEGCNPQSQRKKTSIGHSTSSKTMIPLLIFPFNVSVQAPAILSQAKVHESQAFTR